MKPDPTSVEASDRYRLQGPISIEPLTGGITIHNFLVKDAGLRGRGPIVH